MVPLPRTGTLHMVTLIKLPRLLLRKAMEATVNMDTMVMVMAMAVTVQNTLADITVSLKAVLPRVLIKRKMHLANGPRNNPVMTTMSGPSRPTAPMPTPDGASLTTPSRLSPTMTSNTLARSGPTTTSGRKTTTATTPAMPLATRRPHLRTTRPELRPPTTFNQSNLAIAADMVATESAAMVAITDTENGE